MVGAQRSEVTNSEIRKYMLYKQGRINTVRSGLTVPLLPEGLKRLHRDPKQSGNFAGSGLEPQNL